MKKCAPLDTPHDEQDEDNDKVRLRRVEDNSLDAGACRCCAGSIVAHVQVGIVLRTQASRILWDKFLLHLAVHTEACSLGHSSNAQWDVGPFVILLLW